MFSLWKVNRKVSAVENHRVYSAVDKHTGTHWDMEGNSKQANKPKTPTHVVKHIRNIESLDLISA